MVPPRPQKSPTHLAGTQVLAFPGWRGRSSMGTLPGWHAQIEKCKGFIVALLLLCSLLCSWLLLGKSCCVLLLGESCCGLLLGKSYCGLLLGKSYRGLLLGKSCCGLLLGKSCRGLLLVKGAKFWENNFQVLSVGMPQTDLSWSGKETRTHSGWKKPYVWNKQV